MSGDLWYLNWFYWNTDKAICGEDNLRSQDKKQSENNKDVLVNDR